ncbi:MAG: methyltransferase, TIGR04325 family [Bdellovibrionales bacterium]|nr:methyltransferase, TIGR04325 family [Bdellovibrionales bacterium]
MNIIRKIRNRVMPHNPKNIAGDPVPTYGYFGDYSDYEQAKKLTGGYDSFKIIEKVTSSLKKVRDGEAPYERDSVLFDEIQYAWPLLANLLLVSQLNEKKLRLIDFGGSLGSTYYQNKHLLQHLSVLKWNIVEQEAFVEIGKSEFENENLKFYESIENCIKSEEKIDLLLISGTLQYLIHPYKFLKEVLCLNIPYIIFDRTTFNNIPSKDRITVQKVPPQIYEASYPAWFLSKEKFSHEMSSKYEMVTSWSSLGYQTAIYNNGKFEFGEDLGFFYKLKLFPKNQDV